MYDYLNPALSPEVRTRDLLSRMSVEEKIAQLVKLDGFRSYEKRNGAFHPTAEFLSTVERWPIGSMYGLLRADWWTERNYDNGASPEEMSALVKVMKQSVRERSRWGIPLYIAEEAPHGLMALGATVFPVGFGLGATFDTDLMHRVGRVIGAEAHAAGIQSVYAPILDIIQDPRWSRSEENYSEDPYLTAEFGAAMVKGITEEKTVSTLKHFAAHGSPEGGHNAGSVHVGPIELRNLQLRPFRSAIAAGAKSIMSAYNPVDGEPSTGSHHLLTEILRGELGFDGFVVADRGAIRKLYYDRLADDQSEAAARAVKAGCDVDEGDLEVHSASLSDAFKRGLIDESDLDRAAGRILKLKFEIGLFEEPFAPVRPEIVSGKPAHHAVALEAARKSMTLLKNNGILPLKSIRSLAVIGPNADNVMNQLGDYTAPQKRKDVVTVLDGVRQLAAERNITVDYAQGCRIRLKDDSGFAAAVEAAKKAEATILVLGGSSTKYGSAEIRSETGASVVSQILDSDESDKESGEGTDRATLFHSGMQLELYRELRKLAKPLIVVQVQGRPLLLNEFLDTADALLMAYYPGQFGGQAVAETLFGLNNPAGRLPVSIPRAEGQLPVYYNTFTPRRNYVDMPALPALPFGFGLSYTHFEYSELHVDGREATVLVTNAGDADGEEVVQFYLTDMVSSVMRPQLELCGFERVWIKRGETRKVRLTLTDEVLGYYNESLKFVVEAGRFVLSAGGSSNQLLETAFQLS